MPHLPAGGETPKILWASSTSLTTSNFQTSLGQIITGTTLRQSLLIPPESQPTSMHKNNSNILAIAIIIQTIIRPLSGFLISNRHGRMNVPCALPNKVPFLSSQSRLSSADEDNTHQSLESEETKTELRKVHTTTVCLVPEAKHEHVWQAVTRARTELRDPGLYRWPPHANILYPFFDIKPKNSITIDEDKLNLLSEAVKKCEPFRVALDSFGTFGGKSRGVLYLYPRSFSPLDCDNNEESADFHGDNIGIDSSDDPGREPLIELQSILQEFIPECGDTIKNGKFTPHITLSHFLSLQDALDGQAKLESWWEPLVFDVKEIYVLKRVGDAGQFKVLATLPLGIDSSVEVHDPPLAFPGMPQEEEDWVKQGRMQMKARRNGNGRRGKGRSSRRKKVRGPSKTRDTPEEIVKKRAERAAKRERVAQEAAAIAAAIRGDVLE